MRHRSRAATSLPALAGVLAALALAAFAAPPGHPAAGGGGSPAPGGRSLLVLSTASNRGEVDPCG
jgi:hypothetical protein